MWTLANADSPFSLFIAPKYLGSGNVILRPWQRSDSKLQYDTGGRRKSPWYGSLLPCSQRLSTTWLDRAVSIVCDHIFRSAALGLTTSCFSLPVFCLRLLPPTWCFDRFLGDHLCFLEVRVLTTFLTVVRCGLHGNSSTREHENVRFGWQNSTKKH